MSAQGDDLAPAYGPRGVQPEPRTRELFPVQMGERAQMGGMVNPSSALAEVPEPTDEELAALEENPDAPVIPEPEPEPEAAEPASAEGNGDRGPSKA